jgi:hypothetical protein
MFYFKMKRRYISPFLVVFSSLSSVKLISTLCLPVYRNDHVATKVAKNGSINYS